MKWQKLNERFAFVAVLAISAYWKINNVRGINAGLENKSPPAIPLVESEKRLIPFDWLPNPRP